VNDHISISLESITPALAQVYLATAKRNRRIYQTAVNKWRNAMASGMWEFTGESIQFDTGGHLINGQHRLTALTLLPKETEIMFLVVRGLAEDAQLAMDQGRIRQAGQQLSMLGFKDANVVAAGVRLYAAHSSGLLFRDNKTAQETITTPFIEAWVSEHANIVAALGKYTTDIRRNDAPVSVAYAAAIIFTQKDPAAAREFFRMLSHGAGGSDHPITVLDKRLQRHRREGINISSRDTLGLFIQAWTAWRKGQSLTKFQRPRGGSWTALTFPRAAA